MKELTALTMTPEGRVKIRMRIIGRIVFLHKRKDDPSQAAMIEQMQAKGASIEEADRWIRVDMFATHKFAKLGEQEFDVSEKTNPEMETILAEFYKSKYKQANFKVKVRDIE